MTSQTTQLLTVTDAVFDNPDNTVFPRWNVTLARPVRPSLDKPVREVSRKLRQPRTDRKLSRQPGEPGSGAPASPGAPS